MVSVTLGVLINPPPFTWIPLGLDKMKSAPFPTISVVPFMELTPAFVTSNNTISADLLLKLRLPAMVSPVSID